MREAIALEAADGLDGGGVGDTQAARDVGGARLALALEQVGDDLDIVLGQRGGARGAGGGVAGGLVGRGGILVGHGGGYHAEPRNGICGKGFMMSRAPRRRRSPCLGEASSAAMNSAERQHDRSGG